MTNPTSPPNTVAFSSLAARRPLLVPFLVPAWGEAVLIRRLQPREKLRASSLLAGLSESKDDDTAGLQLLAEFACSCIVDPDGTPWSQNPETKEWLCAEEPAVILEVASKCAEVNGLKKEQQQAELDTAKKD